jgi:hypothetical protein
MAKRRIPDPLERRHTVERNLTPEAALALAEAYLEEERAWEAIAFLVKAQARERMAELREEATRAGDTFLVRELSRALGDEPTAERWRAVAEAARAAGKETFAAQAKRFSERAAAAG